MLFHEHVCGWKNGQKSQKSTDHIHPTEIPLSSNFMQLHQIVYVSIVQGWYIATNIQ